MADHRAYYKSVKTIRDDIIHFSKIHFEQQINELDGYIGIKSRSKKYWKNEYTPTQSHFIEHIADHQQFGKRDLFVSKNIHSTFSVSQKNILAFYNIVIDIDAHGITSNIIERDIPKLIYFLNAEVFGNSVPVPNTIVYTGRGVQLWYAIESLAPSMRDNYVKLSRYIANECNEAIENSPILNIFSVDMAASCKTSGVFRMPGTYNTKAGCYSDIEFIHDEKINVLDYCNYELTDNKTTPITYLRKMIMQQDWDYKRVADYRTIALEKLLNDRLGMENDGIGWRDEFCFIYFCTCFSGDTDKAYEEVQRVNRRFPKPLSESRLKEYLSTAIRKAEEGNPYKFKNQTIIERLGISKEECKAIGLQRKKRTPKNPGITKRKEDTVVQKIIDLAKQGLTKSSIAKAIQVSVATVSKYLHNNKVLTNKEKKRNRMITSIKRGMGLKKFMSTYSASKSLYYKLCNQVKKEKEKWAQLLAEKKVLAEAKKKKRDREGELIRLRKATLDHYYRRLYKRIDGEISKTIIPILKKTKELQGGELLRYIKRKTKISIRNIRYWFEENAPGLLNPV